MTTDNSRNGKLVHSARSSGRLVYVVMYLEGAAGHAARKPHPVECSLIARTPEQAVEVARVLSEALFLKEGG